MRICVNAQMEIVWLCVYCETERLTECVNATERVKIVLFCRCFCLFFRQCENTISLVCDLFLKGRLSVLTIHASSDWYPFKVRLDFTKYIILLLILSYNSYILYKLNKQLFTGQISICYNAFGYFKLLVRLLCI